VKVIGIDPGIAGALVAVDHGQIIAWLDMPTITTTVNGKPKRVLDGYQIAWWLTEMGQVEKVVVEKVQGVQGSGATSAFSFGQGVGIIHGILIALQRPWSTVTPQVWTKHYAVGSDKGLHRQAAQRCFPDHAELFMRVKDDGRADAALLALWGTR